MTTYADDPMRAYPSRAGPWTRNTWPLMTDDESLANLRLFSAHFFAKGTTR